MEPHEQLVKDIEALLEDAKANHFHDFESKTNATPKVALILRLRALIEKTTAGAYDN